MNGIKHLIILKILVLKIIQAKRLLVGDDKRQEVFDNRF